MAEVFSLRLPPDAVKRLRRLARGSGEGPTQLARSWILERLQTEGGGGSPPAPSSQMVAEPAAKYGRPAIRPQDRLEEIVSIAQRRGVARLGVFGSAARDDFDPDSSDVDFTVSFLDMPLGLAPAAYFGLIDDLEGLLGRPTDIVDLESVRNPYLLAEIERDEIVLYEAP